MTAGHKGSGIVQSSPRILIVDDEADIRIELAEYLEYEGYHVNAMGDGLKALEKFEAASADLVIADIKMPKLDGHEFLRRLRALDPRVPVIVITGHYSVTDLKKVTELEVTDIIKKPFRLEEISQKLSRLLKPAVA